MDFKDFEKDYSRLVGNFVLHEYGHSFNNKLSKSIVQIVKVTRTGFRIFGSPDSLFDFNGNLKGKHEMSWVEKCNLLTSSELEAIKNQWHTNKEIKRKRNIIIDKISQLDDSSILDKILDLLNKEG